MPHYRNYLQCEIAQAAAAPKPEVVVSAQGPLLRRKTCEPESRARMTVHMEKWVCGGWHSPCHGGTAGRAISASNIQQFNNYS